MRKLLLIALLALPLFAGQDLQITDDSGSYTIPSSAPFTALSERRIEGRVDVTNWDCTGGTFDAIARLGAGLRVGCTSLGATHFGVRMTSSAAAIDVASRTDILYRAQTLPADSVYQVLPDASWDPGDNVVYLEIWDADGTDYAQAVLTNFTTSIPENVSGSQSIGGVGITANVSWTKLYSTVIQPGPNAPLPDPEGVGDLGDWDFEGDGVDSSSYAMTTTCASCVFGTSAAANPGADIYLGESNWADNPVVRAGATITLDGTVSISHDDVTTLTCVWSDQGGGSGPTAIQFIGSTAACLTTAAFPTFGQYALRLVVTDNSSDATTFNVTVGATATDSDDVVVAPTTTYDFIAGPMLRFDSSNPWPWMDYVQQDLAEIYGSTIPAEGWNTAATGTVAVTNGSATVTGTGTDFQNSFCGGDTTPNAGTNLVIHTDDGLNWRVGVSSCGSATSITMSNNWNQTTDSGLTYAVWTDTNKTEWDFNSSPANFYDGALAHFARWLATGLNQARDYGRQLASGWWDIPFINKGMAWDHPGGSSYTTSPRNYSLAGIALWAHEQGTEATVWPGLAEYTGDANSYLTYSDAREAGYVMAYNALCEELAPDGADRTACGADFDTATTTTAGTFNPSTRRGPTDGWSSTAEGVGTIPDSDLASGTFSATNGSPTLSCDTTCSEWSTLANYWVQEVPSGSTSDVWTTPTEYKVSSASASTLTLASNWTGTTGSGKRLRYSTRHNHYYRPFYTFISGHGFRWNYEGGNGDFRQTMADSGNWLRLYGTRNYAKALYYRTDDAACAYNLANDISDPDNLTGCAYTTNASITINNERYLNLEALGGLGWAVKYADAVSDPAATTLRTYADELFGATWGKWGGPESDNGFAQELDAPDGFKDLGFGLGVGGSYMWPALRIGGVAAENLVSYSVPLDIPGVSGATKASVTLYEPKGSVNRVVNNQTGSTAAVTGDARQGSHLAKVEYKNAMETILQTDWEMIAAPQGSSGAAVEVTGAATFTGVFTF